MQIKTTMKCHLTGSKSSKSLQIVNCGEGVDKKVPSYTVDGNVNWYNVKWNNSMEVT